MISMMTMPASIAITVPAGPATGRNVVPGMANTPQPTMQPKAIAHTSSGDRYRSRALDGFRGDSLIAMISFGRVQPPGPAERSAPVCGSDAGTRNALLKMPAVQLAVLPASVPPRKPGQNGLYHNLALLTITCPVFYLPIPSSKSHTGA